MMTAIVIPQWPIINLGLDLDLVDACIYDFLKYYSNTERCPKMIVDGQSWFNPVISDIIEGLPIINIKTAAGIKKRLEKLSDANVLVFHPANKKYMHLGDNAWRLEFSD